jgi:ATP-dependent Clp protease ATP-binding subunit ClpB
MSSRTTRPTQVATGSSRPATFGTGERSDRREAWPAWLEDFSAALAYADHIVLSGNVRDVFPSGGETGTFQPLVETLGIVLGRRGFETALIYDPADGFRIAMGDGTALAALLGRESIDHGARPPSLTALADIVLELTGRARPSVALVLDYATHLHDSTPQDLENFFVRIDKATRSPGSPGATRRNPTIWIVDHPADLPDWFVVGNDHLREIVVEHPALEDRYAFACQLMREFGWGGGLSPAEREQSLQQFALECEGETLVAMRAIARVATDEGLDLGGISDAIRIHRTGSRRNPWASPVLFARVREARSLLEARIKGQPHAIEKTLDILARSIMGLSGSQSGPRHQKPRGVLFFAGPTGVGKTELAKAVTELLFGDEAACQRFDMSEFMEEASVSRLIGAPPGHPGHERGGELVNAAHRRPFSVFLFDEIEKAHPRILDMFLQILDEGRLTDARGATAHFSQALIIFTSNIGVAHGASTTNMGLSVLPSDSHDELQAKVTSAVHDYFRTTLRRPELVSRIGQNIVVFDFLSPASAALIFGAILDRVLDTIHRRHGTRIEIGAEARAKLRALCIHDYFDGGRGIGNRIETHFINPLARHLFERDDFSDLRVVDVVTERETTTLVFGDPRTGDAEAMAHDRLALGPGVHTFPRRIGREEIVSSPAHAPRLFRPHPVSRKTQSVDRDVN